MRKKLSILATSLLLSIASFSQIQQGTILMGGSATLNLGNNSYLNINPNAGYFINDNFVLGLSMPMSFNEFNNLFGFTPFG